MKSKESLERGLKRMRELRDNEHRQAEAALAKCVGQTCAKPLPYDPTHFNQEREAGIVSEAELERKLIERFEREGWDSGVWKRRV